MSLTKQSSDQASLATNGDREAQSSGYKEILRSSSIIGGAQAINYVVGLVRSKLVAVLIGPAGVGLVGLYVSAAGFLGVIAQLGINQSGVREIADAAAKQDSKRVASIATALRRACWITGFIGWVLTAACAFPLSKWTFGSGEHALVIGLLGCTIVLANVSNGQIALLQGLRRLGDIVRVQIGAAIANTIMAVSLYAVFRERAIVPVIILTALLQMIVSWFFARKVKLESVSQSLAETWPIVKTLIPLGVALMYTGLLVSIVGLGTRAVLIREISTEAAGWYQAAWTLSGMFAGFVLSAMGTDFYPKLSGLIDDHKRANALVNQQIEIGMLLAVPGLVAILCFSPQLLELLYSSKFVPAAEALSLFTIGVFMRTLSWPVSFILLSRKASVLYGSRASLSMFLQLALTILLVREFGFVGAAYAFIAGEATLVLMDTLISRRLTGFTWSRAVLRMLTFCSICLSVGLLLQEFCGNRIIQICGGLILVTGTFLYAIRGLNSRLDDSHKVVRYFRELPGAQIVLAPVADWQRILRRK